MADETVDFFGDAQSQRLCVLFSSHCPASASAPHYCVPPWTVDMDFYGRNDIALGGFLERFCFNRRYACPSASCRAPVTAHVRRFVHDAGAVLVIIRQLANPVAVAPPSEDAAAAAAVEDRSILMWSWCKQCKQVSPIATMSSDTWHFSFAKSVGHLSLSLSASNRSVFIGSRCRCRVRWFHGTTWIDLGCPYLT